MNLKRDADKEPVVAVCGGEARIYGPVETLPNGRRLPRPLLGVKQFAHRGAALQYADEYENPQRKVPA